MPKRSDVSKIKEYLIKLIRYENISNQELMKITGQNSSQVSKWLNEFDNSFPNIEELIILCQRLGISLNELYEMDYNKLYDDLKLEKYAIWDDGIVDGKIYDPCYFMSEKVFKDLECQKILSAYVDLLHVFNDKMNNYMNGITKDVPLLEANKLLMYYVDEGNFDGEPTKVIDEYDFSIFKEFIDYKDYLENKDLNPHFYPMNCDYVMLLNMKKDKKLTFKYLDELKRLDDFFNYSDTLKNKYISQFFSVYSYLLEENQIIDSQGKLFKKIVEYGGVLGDERRYAHIIAKLI